MNGADFEGANVHSTGVRKVGFTVGCVFVCLLGTLWLGARAEANAPIVTYNALPSTTQAGGHPDVQVGFEVENRLNQHSESECNCEDAKDATVELPTGLIGIPGGLPKCTLADFSADECPMDTQVGVVAVNASNGPEFVSAVYNVIPPPEVAGLVAFKLFYVGTPQFTRLNGRTESDYGLEAKSVSIYHALFPLVGFKQVFWGVPADPKHDAFRLDTEATFGFPAYDGHFCDENGSPSGDDPNTVVKPCSFFNPPPRASNSPLRPFTQNPTTCDSPLTSSLEVLAYDGGTDYAEASWPQGTGCNQLSFNPSLYAQPTTTSTDTASGIDVNLTVPQSLSATLPSPSELRAATVTLPPGFSINSNAADGKVSCTDAQARFGTREAAQCPEHSKIGSLVIENPALPGPLPGFVYLGQPLPGNKYRVFLVADGFSTHVKLAGTANPNRQTGQLSISFTDLPQAPLESFNMHFFGSERGALATPTRCGTYPVTSTFTPWATPLGSRTSTQYFTLTSGPDGTPCPGAARPFAPRFSAASAGNTAGAYEPFSVDIARDDGDQNLSGITVSTPPGFSGSLKGIPYCPEPTIANLTSGLYAGVSELSLPACPAASQIGTATAGAGAGSRPLYVPGRVYLAGPYQGAPLSLVIVVPAVSGPYDLGNVVTRAAIEVDSVTARVTTVSDPLPQILDGIPLRARSIRVSLDRPNFALNPTNCSRLSVDATVLGDEGGVSTTNDPYQIANCRSIPYEPRMSFTLSGGLARRGHPAIRAVLIPEEGEANSRRISVTLPKGELLDNSHIGTVCTRVAFARKACPPGSRIGWARATARILDKPLEGPIYLRSSNHDLPDMVLDLRGQIDIEAVGRIDSVNGRLRTIFEAIPDAPVSRIVVKLAGGRKGLLVNSESLCDSVKRVRVRMKGQNGLALVRRPKIRRGCGSKSSRTRHSRRTGAVR